MQCYKCDVTLEDSEAIKCNACKMDFHYICASLTDSEFKRMLPMNKAKWKCLVCKKPSLKTPTNDMEALMAYIDSKFGELRVAFQQDIHTEINPVQTSLTNLESKINSQLSDLTAKVQGCVATVSTLKTDVSSLTRSSEEFRGANEDLKNDVSLLKNKLARMEQQSRVCNIEMQNVPETKNENLENIVMSLGKAVGASLDLSHIRAVHRVAHNRSGSTGSGRPKNIVVQFTTRRVRDNLLAAARVRRDLKSDCLPELKGKPPQPIYINQHLTLDNKILYSKARALKKNGYSWVWAKDGNVMARRGDDTPIIHIRSESDVQKLLDEM